MSNTPLVPNMTSADVVANAPPIASAVQPPMAPPNQSPAIIPQVTPQTPQTPQTSQVAPRPMPSNWGNQPPTPAQQHASVFHNVLSLLGGGQNRPVRDAQGNPVMNADGTPQMAPASSKQLGMGILAGAISSMVAGMATPSKFNEVAPGRFQQDFSGAAAAGAQTAQKFTQEGTKTLAQQQIDDQKTRQFSTMDHNMKLHAAYLSNLKMQGDLLDAGTDEDEPLIKALATAPPIQDPNDPTKTIQPIIAQGVPEDRLLDMMKGGNVTRQSILRDGKIPSVDKDGNPILNDDGTPHMQWTYTVYDQKAMVPMSNEMQGLNPKLDNVSEGTPVPITVLAKYAQQNTEVRGAQQSIDTKMKDLGKDSISLKTAPGANLIKSIYPQIAKYGTDPVDLMFKDLRNDKTVSGSAVAALANAMGVNDAELEKMTNAREAHVLDLKNREAEDRAAQLEAAKEKTPEGQVKLQNAQLDLTLKRQQVAQNDANAKAVQVPTGFVADPRANELDSNTLRAQLTSKGVTVPPDWEALYSIGHNDADLATYTSSPRKGVQTMPRPQALAFIRTYINPNYNEGDYKANANLIKEIRDTKVGTAGGSLLANGVASQHLDMLGQAGKALKNHDVQTWNSICAKAGVEVGSAPPVVFKAIGQKLNEEVEKVTSGGTPQVASLKEAHENLNVAQSPEQIEGVINAYIGLMNGRVSEIDTRANQYTGRHIPVSPSVAKVFNSRGYKVPGQPDLSYKPYIVNGLIVGWTKDGKSMVQTQLYR